MSVEPIATMSSITSRMKPASILAATRSAGSLDTAAGAGATAPEATSTTRRALSATPAMETPPAPPRRRRPRNGLGVDRPFDGRSRPDDAPPPEVLDLLLRVSEGPQHLIRVLALPSDEAHRVPGKSGVMGGVAEDREPPQPPEVRLREHPARPHLR